MRLVLMVMMSFSWLPMASAETEPVTQFTVQDMKELKPLLDEYFSNTDFDALICSDIKKVWHRIIIDLHRSGDQLRVLSKTKFTCNDRHGVHEFEVCELLKKNGKWLLNYCDG